MSLTLSISLPAEWAEQAFVLLTWPHSNTDWVDILDEANECFANIAKEIIKQEDLLIVCSNTYEVLSLLENAYTKKVTCIEMPSNDTWARDHGGITVYKNGIPHIYDFTFNGWGKRFEAELDNQITRQLFECDIFKQYLYMNHLDFILEGGSIESDGEGTLLTTANCLLSKNRNELTKSCMEAKLKDFFGLKQILWLHHGYLAGDDTDSHIDTLARFCCVNTIAYVKCDDVNDEHYDELLKMEEELQQFKMLDGHPYKLISLPMAEAVYEDKQRLPATYANFLIINHAVLMPTYHSAKDEIAKQQLQKAFPDREIVGIDCRTLIKQHGSLHCVTMQFPRVLQ